MMMSWDVLSVKALLAPTKIYVKPMLAAIDAVDVKAVSHITGGGFYENIPRMLKDGTRAKVYKEKFEVLPIFKKIQEKGGISEHDMYNTYNMGVGMMFVVPESQAEEAVNAVNAAGEKAFVIGEITEGEKGVGYMLRIGVLVSGGGTNLQAIIDAISNGKNNKCGKLLPWLVRDPEYTRLKEQKLNNIPSIVISRKAFNSLEEHDTAVCEHMKYCDVDLIVMAGYLSIVGDKLINEFNNKIINIHPSLIPSFCGPGFYGLKVHEAALERGVKITGATVHIVNEVCDGGPILLQKAVEVKRPGDTPEVLQKRVMEEAEWEILPKAIDLIANGKI